MKMINKNNKEEILGAIAKYASGNDNVQWATMLVSDAQMLALYNLIKQNEGLIERLEKLEALVVP